MADKFLCKIVGASLTASDNTVVAALAGTGFKVWQVIVGNTGAADWHSAGPRHSISWSWQPLLSFCDASPGPS
jgi:hypothetical protein